MEVIVPVTAILTTLLFSSARETPPILRTSASVSTRDTIFFQKFLFIP